MKLLKNWKCNKKKKQFVPKMCGRKKRYIKGILMRNPMSAIKHIASVISGDFSNHEYTSTKVVQSMILFKSFTVQFVVRYEFTKSLKIFQ